MKIEIFDYIATANFYSSKYMEREEGKERKKKSKISCKPGENICNSHN